MAAKTNIITPSYIDSWKAVDLNAFIRENITSSWLQTLWLLALFLVTLYFTVGQFQAAPIITLVVTIAWAIGLWSAVSGEIQHKHSKTSRWLKNRLFSSITNSLLTLFLTLSIIAAFRGLWSYAVVRATFDTAITAPEFRTPESGATWGVIWGSRKLLTTGTLDVSELWRVNVSFWFIVGLSLVSFFVYRPPLKNRVKYLRVVLTTIWLLSPVILFIFLAGMDSSGPLLSFQSLLIGEVVVLGIYGLLFWQKVVKFKLSSFSIWIIVWPALYITWRLIAKTEMFPLINVDRWGGFLFTMIISVFAIVASFPLGVVLALGRRSSVRGIPSWVTWPAAIAVTLWGLLTSTTANLDIARNSFEKVLAYWPLLILLITYAFQRFFKGNVIAAASTIYIEVIRGVPLITVLFMAIIMAPLFFPQGFQVKNAWAVLVAFSLFTAAYLAENVRGGLQSIPNGQYEAADAIGLNTFQKMRFIILPQALRAVIPAIVGLFIGVFKDSSLVAIVGLFDLLGISNAIVGNPQWLGLRTELYLFASIVYFIGSFAMSSYSRRLETQLGLGVR